MKTMKLWRVNVKARLKCGQPIPGICWNIFMFDPSTSAEDVETWFREKYGEDFISAEYLREEEVED